MRRGCGSSCQRVGHRDAGSRRDGLGSSPPRRRRRRRDRRRPSTPPTLNTNHSASSTERRHLSTSRSHRWALRRLVARAGNRLHFAWVASVQARALTTTGAPWSCTLRGPRVQVTIDHTTHQSRRTSHSALGIEGDQFAIRTDVPTAQRAARGSRRDGGRGPRNRRAQRANGGCHRASRTRS